MRLVFVILFYLVIHTLGFTQCNTTLNKFLPDGAIDNEDRFGSALAATDRYLLVGAENSDTLGILYAGAAFLYEKTAAGWAYRAMFTPSDPDEFDFFGTDVEIDQSGDFFYIINRRYSKGALYIFEKPSTGWHSMTETIKLEFPDYFDFDANVSVTEDGNSLVVGSSYNPEAKFYIATKSNGQGWANADIATIFAPFGLNSGAFGGDIFIRGDYFFVSSDFEDNGSGIYVYKKNVDTYDYLAKLSISTPPGSTGYFGRFLTGTDDMIATMGLVYDPTGESGQMLFIFKKEGEWKDSFENVKTKIPDYDNSYRFPFPIQVISSKEIAASVLVESGEYYAGKVVLVKSEDESWQNLTSEVIFQRDNLATTSEFAGQMVWNGNDLVRAVGLKEIGLSARNAVVSLTRSANIWGGLQHVTIDRYNSSNFRNGYAVHKTGETLFSGTPYDGTSGRGAGAVYVYEKSGDEFTKVHTILPSRRVIRPAGGSDAGFGYSLSSYEDVLAVGAPSFKYSESSYGKIFLYKRTSTSWSSAILIDSLNAPYESQLNHVGTRIAMNDNVLFASAYNNSDNIHTNAVVIFEKINDKWEYQSVIDFGKPLDKSWPTLSFSLLNNELLVGSYFSINGGVSIIAKNETSGKWEMKVTFDAGIYSGFGSDVKFLQNHLFVGTPGYDNQGVKKSGAVLVYAKLPHQQWDNTMQPAAIIVPEIPIEGSFFGSSIDVIGNTLAVGAPGKFLTEDSQVRTIPGNTYIIQTEDYFWQKTTEFLNLQGDRYATEERDYFGSDVGIDEQFFYIGASNENTSVGSFSGATYYIPSPPTVFLIPPICRESGVVQLKAYPFNGTWSGPGIIDPSGLFDPMLAGAGRNDLSYVTINCAFEGRIQIEVIDATITPVEQLSPSAIEICSESTTLLQLSYLPDSIYEWYYIPESSTTFLVLGFGNNVKEVRNPGRYFARVYRAGCYFDSPEFTLSIADVSFSIGPQPIVCEHNMMVTLSASPDNGIWSGVGILNGQFNSGNLINATYELVYNFVTPKGCFIEVIDSIKVNVIEPVRISKLPGDYCLTGAATLQVNSPDDDALSFSWYYSETANGEMSQIQKPLVNPAIFYDPGFYKAIVTNGDCTIESDTLALGFNLDLSYDFPQEDLTDQVCNQSEYILNVSAREGTTFEWLYTPNESAEFSTISGEVSNQIFIMETGKYKVQGTFGFCAFSSKPMMLEFKSDSIYAPNVFTPNGDSFNNTFKIVTGISPATILIFNRYGKEVFHGDGGEWNGGDSPSGTYYWVAKYEGCESELVEVKGWVQLIR